MWLRPVAGGDPRQLTHFDDYVVNRLAFTPEGTHLVFSADHQGDELQQIHLVPATGGRSVPLAGAAAQHVLTAAPFSPDGTWLAFAANDRDPAVQDLLLLDRTTGATTRVHGSPSAVSEPAGFSPDSKLLLVRTILGNTDMDLRLLDLGDPARPMELLTPHDGEEQHHPGPWAPDGSGFHEITDAGRDHSALVFHDLAGGVGPALTPADWSAEQVARSAEGDTLAWTVNEDGTSALWVRRSGAPFRPRSVPAGQITCLTASDDGRRLAFLLDSATRPTEVCVLDLDLGTFEYLTDSRPARLADGSAAAIAPEAVRYPTHDGRHVPALLYRPAGEGPFPVVVSVHGGPEDQERPVYRYSGLYQCLLDAGIAVLGPNIRGSSGYGTAYQKLVHRDWGGGDLLDLEHAVHYLYGTPWADRDRIAVFGASYGGFAALSCLSRLPQYWAAGVSVVGQSNLVTFARAVPPTWRPLMARWLGDPDEDAELLTARSPLTHADRITAPLFVIQGARDPRVARAESDQIVASLRSRGQQVRYDVYEDEGHGFAKRENEVRAWSDVASFLIGQLVVQP